MGLKINLLVAESNQVERLFIDPTSDLCSFGIKYIVDRYDAHYLNKKGAERLTDSVKVWYTIQ